MTTYYLHTLDGKPAQFIPSQRTICFIGKYGPSAEPATSLRQIRREQAIDRAENPDTSSDFKHDYVRIRMPVGRGR